MNGIRKRLLAILLCVVISVSLLPMPALAEEGMIEITEQDGEITAAEEGNIFFSEAETAEENGAIRNDFGFESVDVSAYILQEGGLFAPNSQLSSEQKKGAKDAGRESYLNEAEALLYAAAAGWDGSTDSITVDISEISCPTSDIWDVWINVLNDNPDLFYMGYMTYDYSDGIVTSVTMTVNTEDYSFQDVEVFRNKTNRIFAGVESSWSDEQKALYVHDYLVTHCEYDLTYSNYSAYDAIISESCVCQGYALAYCFLLQKCGVECEIVTSWALNHAWNLVTIGSAQYYVDCTWDDPVANASETLYQDFCRHVNFLRSRDGLISTRHNSTDWVDGDGNDVYNCVKTGTAYESAWWNGCNSAIPHVGNKWAYFQGSDSGVYLHDYSTGKNLRLFTLSGKWYVWGSTSSYYTGYSHLAAYGKQFYISTADKIYRFTSDGKQEVFYSLTKNELAQGYIYGIRVEKSTLYYRLYTDERSGDFAAEHSLVLGEVIPEIVTSGVCGDDLTWTLDDLYTLTISGTGDMWDFYGKSPEWHNWCKAITSLVIQPGATSVGNNAFYECTALNKVTIPDGVIRIGDDAFSFCGSLQSVMIPDSVTSIGELAFERCTGLKEVTLSNSLVSIGYGAFLACTALKSITIPAGVTSTGDYTFQGCVELKEVTLSNSVVSIGDGAFCECTALKNITIPASVTSIGFSAFGDCTALSRIVFNGSAPAFTESAFSEVTATAYYPAEDATWTEDVRQDYGGTITWMEKGSLELNKTNTVIPCGKSETLIAKCDDMTVKPDWSSSDPEIAVVNTGGKVTAKKAGKATITASYEGSTASCDILAQFTDVTDSSRSFYPPVYWALENGITTGTSKTTFSPNKSCTRAQIVTFLWRLKGCPEPSLTDSPFTDVTNPSSSYYKPVLWALENGITTGTSATAFSPDRACTRAQCVTFLWRALGCPEPGTETSPFTDVTNPEASYYKAVLWALENGITTGTSKTTFSPNNTCTRGQIVTFLYRYNNLSQ